MNDLGSLHRDNDNTGTLCRTRLVLKMGDHWPVYHLGM